MPRSARRCSSWSSSATPTGDAGELAVSDQASLTGSGTVDVKLTAPPDDRTLGEANDRILAAVRDLPGVRKVESDFTAAQPSVQVTVDREKAAAMGLTEERAVGLIAAKTADRSITRITLQGRELEVYLSSSTKAQTVEDVRNLDLGGFKIDRIATVSEVRVAPTVATENAVRTVTIAVTPPESSDNLGAVSTAVTDAVHATNCPTGATTSMGGASAELTDSFGQLGVGDPGRGPADLRGAGVDLQVAHPAADPAGLDPAGHHRFDRGAADHRHPRWGGWPR